MTEGSGGWARAQRRAGAVVLVALVASGCADTNQKAVAGPTDGPRDEVAAVAFADTNLGAAVRFALALPAATPIPADSAAALTRLAARGRGIASLAGIERLNALRELDLADNRVTDVTPLAGLTGLVFLDLSANAVVDIAPLAALAGLEVLVLDRNPVADLAPLAQLGALQSVSLEGVPADATGRAVLAALAVRGVAVSANLAGDLGPVPREARYAGTRILFLSRETSGAPARLVTMDAVGGDRQTVLAGPPEPETATWSPGGERIAYTTRDGTELWMAVRDGTGAERLLAGGQRGYLSSPAWSPDGRRIAIMKGRRSGSVGVQVWETYTVDVATRDTVRLTHEDASALSPGWSPDGRQLCYGTLFDGTAARLQVIDAGGGMPRTLLVDAATISWPEWSRDGSRIAFTRTSIGGFSGISVVNADGTDPRALADAMTHRTHPTWSPDGLEIAFHGRLNGNDDIWVVDAAGGEPVNLTNSDADEWNPEWSR